MTGIIDGKAVAKEVQKQIKEEVEGLERRWGLAPGLAVVLVGDGPDSHIYVRKKEKGNEQEESKGTQKKVVSLCCHFFRSKYLRPSGRKAAIRTRSHPTLTPTRLT